MDFWQRDEQWTIPIDSPAYPPPGGYYADTMFQTVFFTTDPENIAPLLPEPLVPSASGRCCAFAIDATFCADYGPFKEVGVAVGCQLDGQEGFFLPTLFLNSSDAISPGREVWGSPKKFANITITQDGNELTSTAIRADVPMIQINSRMTEPAQPDEIPGLWPMYLLKVIPSVEGHHPAVKQLVQSPPPENVKTTRLFKGPGVVSFRPTVAGEFWRLQPRSFQGAVYQVCSFTQGFGQVVKDYLQ